jgi:hypothetical protein
MTIEAQQLTFLAVRDCDVITDDSTVIARLRTNSAAWDFVDRLTGEIRYSARRNIWPLCYGGGL